VRKKLVSAVVQRVVEYRSEVLLDEYGHIEEIVDLGEELQVVETELIEIEHEIETEGIIEDPREVE
jgi:hypothetical protein